MGSDVQRLSEWPVTVKLSRPAEPRTGTSLLLVLPLPVRYDEHGELHIESQAANGLELWAKNFDRVTAVCVLAPERELQSRSSVTWRSVAALQCKDRVRVIGFPWAYRLRTFLGYYKENRALLRQLITESSHLVFAISYVWGDWASLGCLEAMKQHRRYGVWKDLVDHQVVRWSAGNKSILPRLYGQQILSRLVKQYHHYLIGHCQLGLFHGMDCYRAYSPYCRNSHLVHDVHLKPADSITEERLGRKAEEIKAGCTLRIGYAGRADAGKGGLDWIGVVKALVDAGHRVSATWLGDGPILEEMRSAALGLGIAESVRLPGFVGDRTEVLEFLKDSHLLLFCHKLQESPRILVESLICGTPIIGYHSSYAHDLIADNDWGQLTPPDDVQALAGAVAILDQKRDRLAEMVKATASAALIYNDEAVFRHRSDLIKAYL